MDVGEKEGRRERERERESPNGREKNEIAFIPSDKTKEKYVSQCENR